MRFVHVCFKGGGRYTFRVERNVLSVPETLLDKTDFSQLTPFEKDALMLAITEATHAEINQKESWSLRPTPEIHVHAELAM